MPRPTTPPSRGFRFPTDLPVIKIVPDYDNDTATITFMLRGQERTRTFPFDWNTVGTFEADAVTTIRGL